MKKKLAWLLRPSYAICFAVMGIFVAAAFIRKHYLLGAVEAVITLAMMGYYLYRRNLRNREVQTYLHKHMHTLFHNTVFIKFIFPHLQKHFINCHFGII